MKRSIFLLTTFAVLVFAGSTLQAQEALCGRPLANRAAGHQQAGEDGPGRCREMGTHVEIAGSGFSLDPARSGPR